MTRYAIPIIVLLALVVTVAGCTTTETRTGLGFQSEQTTQDSVIYDLSPFRTPTCTTEVGYAGTYTYCR